MGAVITDPRLLRRYPLASRPPGARGPLLQALTEAEGESVAIRDLLSGAVTAAVVHAADLPDPLPEGLRVIPMAQWDRREVLVGSGNLGGLPDGTPVGVPTPRHGALLRALHPTLEPVGMSAEPVHRIVPVWTDPTLESRGEILERDSWLPGPGDGIPVLVLGHGAPDGTRPDPAASAVLAAERAVGRRFPGALLSVRAQPFADRMRLQGNVVSLDGRRAVRGEVLGPLDRPGEVAAALADLLERRGAHLIPSPAGP